MIILILVCVLEGLDTKGDAVQISRQLRKMGSGWPSSMLLLLPWWRVSGGARVHLELWEGIRLERLIRASLVWKSNWHCRNRREQEYLRNGWPSRDVNNCKHSERQWGAPGKVRVSSVGKCQKCRGYKWMLAYFENTARVSRIAWMR